MRNSYSISTSFFLNLIKYSLILTRNGRDRAEEVNVLVLPRLGGVLSVNTCSMGYYHLCWSTPVVLYEILSFMLVNTCSTVWDIIISVGQHLQYCMRYYRFCRSAPYEISFLAVNVCTIQYDMLFIFSRVLQLQVLFMNSFLVLLYLFCVPLVLGSLFSFLKILTLF